MVYGDESIPSNYLIEYTCTADTDFLFVDLNFRETRNVCKNFILNDQYYYYSLVKVLFWCSYCAFTDWILILQQLKLFMKSFFVKTNFLKLF